MNWGWGFKPLPPGNSNPGRRLAHRPHTPISIAPCALALAPTLLPQLQSPGAAHVTRSILQYCTVILQLA